MKKILFLLFSIIILSAGSVFAYINPRWGYFPLNVYIEPHSKKALVEKAFSTWQSESGIAKFRYVTSEKYYPNIVVKFADKNPNQKGSNFENAVGLAYSYTPLGFYAKATITIYLTSPGGGTPLSDNQIYGIALHEIGHAMGLGHSPINTDIMSPIEHGQTSLSQNDIERFKLIYTP